MSITDADEPAPKTTSYSFMVIVSKKFDSGIIETEDKIEIINEKNQSLRFWIENFDNSGNLIIKFNEDVINDLKIILDHYYTNSSSNATNGSKNYDRDNPPTLLDLSETDLKQIISLTVLPGAGQDEICTVIDSFSLIKFE